MCTRVVEGISVRAWTKDDVEFVVRSITAEGWGHTRRDVERCWDWEPEGCFIAESGRDPVGHVSTICYGKLAWIGLLIVIPEKRGRGIGTTLMQRAVEHLRHVGAETVRLEAEEAAIPLYKSLGFHEEFDSLRFSGRKGRQQVEHSDKEIAPMEEQDIERLRVLDSENFGFERIRVLKELFSDDPSHSFVASHNGKPLGYIMARKIRNGFWIGPWVCEDSNTARILLETSMASIEEDNAELHVGFPSSNEAMSTLATMEGLEFAGKNRRMRFGSSGYHGVPQRVYGLAGPEKG